jgi:hypothetical protein
MEAPNIIRANSGIVGTVCHPLFRVPTGYGRMTILKAYLDPGIAAATVGNTYLVDAGTALGTAQSATIGTLAIANGTFTADVPKAFSLVAAPTVDAGHWVSLYVVTGTTIASSAVVVEYKYGK